MDSSFGFSTMFLITLLVLLLYKPLVVQAADLSDDRRALLSFKSLLDDPDDVLSSWNDTTAVCDWNGVTCSNQTTPVRVTSLVLQEARLGGGISPSIGNLSFLTKLSLLENKLDGRLPEEIGELQRLEMLNLGSNHFEGEMPKSLTRLSKLNFLILKDNNFTGEILPEIGKLNNLTLLSLRQNNLKGSIPPSIGNISTLMYLFLSDNNLVGSIPVELSKNVNLEVLDLSFNNLTGEIPLPLFNFSNLWTFGVGFNQLEGTLPSDFGQNLPSLGYLYLYNNRFEGPIPPTIINSSSLELVELHSNNFSGVIPPNLGELQNLTKLSLSYNKFVAKDVNEWAFMDSLTRCSILEEIDLDTNNLSGVLPNSISNLSTSLEWLRIRDNKISGEIPKDIGRLTGLVTIDFSINQLTGTIPSSIGNIKGLKAFIVTTNKLSGEIPSTLGDLENMLEFYLGDNNFVGHVPASLASLKKLIVLDLARNNLNGTIPKGLFGISSIALFFNISDNHLTGELPNEVGLLKNLKSFDASENKFHGQIPSSLGQCQQLEFLYLQGNNFSSEIPSGLKDLKGVQILDLSRNNLSGSIPIFFETSWNDTIQYLNLSFNKLEGEVPSKGVFSNISLFSVEGNEGLCGGNLELTLKSCDNGTRSKKLTTPIIITIVVIVVVLVSLCVIFIVYKVFSRKRNDNQITCPPIVKPIDGQILQLSYKDIAKATNNFSQANLIGSGGYGTVYKGTYKDEENKDKEIAVKILNNHQIRAASKSFDTECEVLRTVRHRNLVKILTACSTVDGDGNDFKALVYEFMPNGSLQGWLDSDRGWKLGHLDLLQRFDIAYDVATAIRYLHEETEVSIVHCDLKPSNVLLDRDLNARVSDFGISRFLSKDSTTMTCDIKGSFGYIAPECGMGARISKMWDVYSYGILLLEMFTGKSPTDEIFVDGLTLHKYVEDNLPDHALDIADQKLLSSTIGDEVPVGESSLPKIRDNLQEIMRIGLICSNHLPKDRMDMEDVLRHMDNIRGFIFAGKDGRLNRSYGYM